MCEQLQHNSLCAHSHLTQNHDGLVWPSCFDFRTENMHHLIYIKEIIHRLNSIKVYTQFEQKVSTFFLNIK